MPPVRRRPVRHLTPEAACATSKRAPATWASRAPNTVTAPTRSALWDDAKSPAASISIGGPFLVSYDPTIDPDASILERILAAVGPVGAGISLEYFFSSVDNERYGCGTKLPHNVTGLIGVMNGHLSDLRTGLPCKWSRSTSPCVSC